MIEAIGFIALIGLFICIQKIICDFREYNKAEKAEREEEEEILQDAKESAHVRNGIFCYRCFYHTTPWREEPCASCDKSDKHFEPREE